MEEPSGGSRGADFPRKTNLSVCRAFHILRLQNISGGQTGHWVSSLVQPQGGPVLLFFPIMSRLLGCWAAVQVSVQDTPAAIPAQDPGKPRGLPWQT